VKKSIKNQLQKVPLLIAVLFLVTIGSYAQQAQFPELMIHFRVSASNVDPSYMSNEITLSRIAATLTSENASYISSIRIEGYASPDGVSTVNKQIARKRAEALKHYIITNYSSYIQPAKITIQGMGVNWDGLRWLADGDYKLPYRSEVLYIIDNVHTHIDAKANISRKKSLMDLGPKTWDYMLANYFPLLRTGKVINIIIAPNTPEDIVISINNTLNGIKNQPPSTVDTVKNATPKPEKIVEESLVTDTVYLEEYIVSNQIPVERIEEEEFDFGKKSLFAVKTNLLFDAISALNVEIEIPTGKRWSIAGEYIFPWWLWESKQYALQSLSGNLEGRYWFGNREGRPQLTGWFAGLYAGGGYYDIEWGDRGYQGEFFIASGFSGGYAHTISKNGNWRMEYSLGVGYMQTKYREYIPRYGPDDEWHLIRKQSGKYHWLGPTRAKISLVWMLNRRYKKKEGAK